MPWIKRRYTKISRTGVPDGSTAEHHAYSLSEVHRSIQVPHGASFLRMLLAFTGPGLLVAVGYMDPGNWATDLAGGAQFGYTLLVVITISNIIAIILQALSLKLGVVTGRDLAQACRDQFSKPVGFGLWVLAEIAISATDLAEVVGSAVAIQLLFGLPLLVGVLITALDVVLVLFLNSKGFRYIEAIVGALIAVISLCFIAELIFARPEWGGVLLGFIVPRTEIITNPAMLYIAIGILGATVMPHNLYLHSSIIQTRKFDLTPAGKARGHPLRHDRLDVCIDGRVVHQRRHPDPFQPPPSTPPGTRMWPRSRMLTNCWRLCWVRVWPASCLRLRCWPRARTPP